MKEIIERKEVDILAFKFGVMEKLKGTIFMPEGYRRFPGVVFYHGKESNRKGYLPIGEELSKNGIAALAFDFSSDELSEREAEAEEVYSFFKYYRQIDEECLGILGSSMGADPAVIIASKFKAPSLVLRAPTAHSISQIREFSGSLLVIASENDRVSPSRMIDLYLGNAVKAKRREKYVIKGAGHFFGEPNSPYRDEFKRIVVDWFRQTLKPAFA